MGRSTFFLFLVFWAVSFCSIAQGESVAATFQVNESNQLGFDRYEVTQWRDAYDRITLFDSSVYVVPYRSTLEGIQDTVYLSVDSSLIEVFGPLRFFVNDSLVRLRTEVAEDRIRVFLPMEKAHYQLQVKIQNLLVGQLNVRVYPRRTEEIHIIPTYSISLYGDSIQDYLNGVFVQAGFSLRVRIGSLFSPEPEKFNQLSNPSPDHDRYTRQMIELRDTYFEAHPNANRNAYYIFVVPSFVDENIKGYMVRNKAIGFIKGEDHSDFFRSLARQLGFGAGALDDTWRKPGPRKGTTNNLMDEGEGTHLTFEQWEGIQQNCHTFSFYDDYEDIRTSNGLVAFYFWEEDSLGNLLISGNDFLQSIERPYKKNKYARHLDLNSFFYRPLFSLYGQVISVVHLIAFFFFSIFVIAVHQRALRFFPEWKGKRWKRWTFRIAAFVVFVVLFLGSFSAVKKSYAWFEIDSGVLDYLGNAPLSDVVEIVRNNDDAAFSEPETIGSEVLIKKQNVWHVQRMKPVLYFDVYLVDGEWKRYRFRNDSDSLVVETRDFQSHALSQYLVLNYIGEDGTFAHQKVFNHLGKEVTEKLAINDPAKRLLVFVNGYRPTSFGRTFEDNFSSIRENGLEYPESKNFIYDFDRYEYWRPWKEIDLLFQRRINPSETVYADGHFSVATSNHQSLLNFSTLTSVYPDRCADSSHHTCQYTYTHSWSYFRLGNQTETAALHPRESNVDGFNYRREKGKVAGRNLLQSLNEIPNRSENDTLYVVAHSMGYAYALGMLEALRGRIHFGAFYIVAPENASAGNVNKSEWKQVWQYGSDFERWKKNAPCLLDGIASQVCAGGLTNSDRAFIPGKLYTRMGFYDAHFIGYYTWIFDLEVGQPGWIRQR